MNARKLQNRLSFLVRLLAPMPLVAWSTAACGGAAESSGTGGSTQAGGSSAGGAGAGAGGTTTNGGAGMGGASSGGSGSCVGGASTGGDCVSPHPVEMDAACAPSALTREACLALCNTSYLTYLCTVSASSNPGKINVLCPPTCVAGRRPANFVEHARVNLDLGDHFARTAELEAAAVSAFRHLRADLHAQRAPRALLRALSRAARDERRHARATKALARRRGGRTLPPCVSAPTQRSLEAVATENAVEGCVRELYGALVATYQAHHAADPEVRSVMRRIAHEETRHAALSMQVQRWLESRLDGAACARIQAERERAVAALRTEIEAPIDDSIARTAGLPVTAKALELHAALRPLMSS